MATKRETMQRFEDLLAPAGEIRTRSMFGEGAIYKGEKLVALIADDLLFIKPSTASGEFIDRCIEAPPYPGAKNYLMVPDENVEAEWLIEAIVATYEALQEPKPKKPKGKI